MRARFNLFLSRGERRLFCLLLMVTALLLVRHCWSRVCHVSERLFSVFVIEGNSEDGIQFCWLTCDLLLESPFT